MLSETQSKISDWLEAVGVETGTQLGLDRDGHCLILFGEKLECMVEVPEDSEIVFVYVALKRAPDDLAARSNLFERALELNMFSLATGGASVTFDRRTQEVILSFSADVAAMDDAVFQEVLGDFLELASDLHKKLAEEPSFVGQSTQVGQTNEIQFRA
jgi:hypothetical protein